MSPSRAERFRTSLARAASVTEAIYDAGFGFSSRAYEGAQAELGMTPSAYRKGAAGLAIRYGVAACSLDWLVVATTERGVCAIEFGDDPAELAGRLRERFPGARLDEGGPDFVRVLEQVVAFVEAPSTGLDLPLDIRGTAFRQRVWDALREVLPGTTVGYAELAARIGRPGATTRSAPWATVRPPRGSCRRRSCSPERCGLEGVLVGHVFEARPAGAPPRPPSRLPFAYPAAHVHP